MRLPAVEDGCNRDAPVVTTLHKLNIHRYSLINSIAPFITDCHCLQKYRLLWCQCHLQGASAPLIRSTAAVLRMCPTWACLAPPLPGQTAFFSYSAPSWLHKMQKLHPRTVPSIHTLSRHRCSCCLGFIGCSAWAASLLCSILGCTILRRRAFSGRFSQKSVDGHQL
jgi:hypothetical protein